MKIVRNNKLFEEIFNDNDIQNMIDAEDDNVVLSDDDSFGLTSTYVFTINFYKIIPPDTPYQQWDTHIEKECIDFLNVLERRIRYVFSQAFDGDYEMVYYVNPYKYNYNPEMKDVTFFKRDMKVKVDSEYNGIGSLELYVFSGISTNLDILKSMELLSAALYMLCVDFTSSVSNVHCGLSPRVYFYNKKVFVNDICDNYNNKFVFNIDKIHNLIDSERNNYMMKCIQSLKRDVDYADIMKIYRTINGTDVIKGYLQYMV